MRGSIAHVSTPQVSFSTLLSAGLGEVKTQDRDPSVRLTYLHQGRYRKLTDIGGHVLRELIV